MNTNKQEEVIALATILYGEFKSLALSIEETAQVVNRSEVSLSRDRAECVGIPFSKLGKGKGSDRVRYNIYDISRFIVSRKMMVLS